MIVRNPVFFLLLHRDLIFSVWNQIFPLGGNWSDEKVSLGVVVAVLATCVPLANARTCHSYTDCVASVQPRFPAFSCLALLDNLVPVCLFQIGPRRIHTVRVRGGNKKYRALRLDVGNFSWGSECE